MLIMFPFFKLLAFGTVNLLLLNGRPDRKNHFLEHGSVAVKKIFISFKGAKSNAKRP